MTEVPEVQNPTTKPVIVTFNANIQLPVIAPVLQLTTQLVQQGFDEIRLFMTTPGGDVATGFTLFHYLRSLPVKIVTHNVGSVNSIGNVVFLAGEERYAGSRRRPSCSMASPCKSRVERP